MPPKRLNLAAPSLYAAQVEDDLDDAAAFAEVIKRAGMAGPASIALRIGGPLAWVGGQMLWAVQPLLEGLRVGARSGRKSQAGIVPRLAKFLEGEGNVATLVAHLETQPSRRAKAARKIGHGPSGDREGGEADGPL